MIIRIYRMIPILVHISARVISEERVSSSQTLHQVTEHL
jgi:hypothetical protein